jgi:predicted Rossmann fold nucleotide-binding protein DprA/Smf involved in DNA uptake
VRALCAIGRSEGPPSGFDSEAWRAAVMRWRPRLAEGARLVAAALGTAAQRGLTLLTPEDSDAWPTQLADLGDHAPAALWVRGDQVEALDALMVWRPDEPAVNPPEHTEPADHLM